MLSRNLHDVFGEADPARRLAAIDKIFTGEHRGHSRAPFVAESPEEHRFAERSVPTPHRDGTALLLMDFLNEAPIEALFAETTGKPFGEKIKSFKAWCDLGAPAAQKAALQAIYKDLDALLPKRNFIVHGETREGEFKGKPRQTYRVGLVKNNLEYLDEFDRSEHGPNIFDVSQVKAASQNCRKILKAIADLRSSIPVSDEPYEEEPDDPADWPPPAR